MPFEYQHSFGVGQYHNYYNKTLKYKGKALLIYL